MFESVVMVEYVEARSGLMLLVDLRSSPLVPVLITIPALDPLWLILLGVLGVAGGGGNAAVLPLVVLPPNPRPMSAPEIELAIELIDP